MSDWYYAAGGVQVGPVTIDYLRMLLAEKRIERDSLVWTASMPEWKPAAAVTELAGQSMPLFAIANWKLAVMTLCTLGVYQVFWGYKHWKAIRTRTGQDLLPLARGFFSIFFFNALVQEVNDAAVAQQIDRRLPPSQLTALFMILMFSQLLPNPFWLLWFAILVPIGIVQKLANEVNQKAAPLADRNARIRGWNWLALIVGIPLVLLAIAGAFMPQ
jgi:hypothetical protein